MAMSPKAPQSQGALYFCILYCWASTASRHFWSVLGANCRRTVHGGSTGHHLDGLQRQGTNAARVSCSAKDTELKALKPGCKLCGFFWEFLLVWKLGLEISLKWAFLREFQDFLVMVMPGIPSEQTCWERIYGFGIRSCSLWINGTSAADIKVTGICTWMRQHLFVIPVL